MILHTFCYLFILLIANCYGRPFSVVSNLGASADAGWKLGGRVGYYRTNPNYLDNYEPGADLTIGTNGRLGAAGGYGLGLQVGQNGENGGNGLAIAGKAGGRAGGVTRGGITGRFGRKMVDARGQAGADVGGNVYADKGIYITPPKRGHDNWGFLNNYETNDWSGY